MQFGLMFFASNENALIEDKYHLVIESAKFGDQHGFSSIWLPERHFTQLGCLYSNPAVLHAALSRETKQIRLRAGSVVLPLHHPIRIAEEWAVVDNLSGGRVDISFASGWNPNDFAFFPENYLDRYERMYSGIQTVQKLWRGESIWVKSGNGSQVEVRTYPTPIQPSLPVWVTAASNPHTFTKAGEIGANLLTHMFDHDLEDLAEKISLYRQALSTHGHDAESGQVTVMLHTFIGEDINVVREQVRIPFCEYLKSNSNLLKDLAQSRGRNIDISTLAPRDLNEFVNFLFERFFSTRALLGTSETCLDLVRQLKQVGVNEIACLLDFGLEADLILSNLPYLNQLKEHSQVEALTRTPFGELQLGQKNGLHNEFINTDSGSDADPTISEVHPSSLKQIQSRCLEEIDSLKFYKQVADFGVDYSSSFLCTERLWRGDGEALGQIKLPKILESEASLYKIHPVLMDNCFLILGALFHQNSQKLLSIHTGMRQIRIFRQAGNQVWSHAISSGKPESKDMFEGDIRILNVSGDLVAEIRGLRFRLLDQALADAAVSPHLPLTTQKQELSSQRVKATQISSVFLAAQPEEQYQILEGYLHEEVARVLALPISQLDVNQPLVNLGLDSLMAIELRNRIEVGLGVVVSMVSLLQNPSTVQLVSSILSTLSLDAKGFGQVRDAGEDNLNEEEIIL
ncbi:MAG: hypothetical protein C6Y22_29445 [Hapalosiphonaceae cyanobacterium JJU2]|nr:MAG: hypothetical protein C6Y22_29445 [Hapalosiphonaceae cyanobacterium JJU2]